MSALTELPTSIYPRSLSNPTSFPDDFISRARALCWHSQLAYETDHPEKITEILRSWDDSADLVVLRRLVKSILPTADTRVILSRLSSCYVISFAGTDPLSLANWLTDLNAFRSADHLHQGFSDAAAVVRDDLFAALEKVPSELPIYFTGHSLGGALAVITASSLQAAYPTRRLEAFTFGQPRTGANSFVVQYNQTLGPSTYRFVHGDDIVPTVPRPQEGYAHVGRLIWCRARHRFEKSQLSEVGSDQPESEPLPQLLLTNPIRAFASFNYRPGPQVGGAGHIVGLLPSRIRNHLPDAYLAAFGDYLS